MLVANRGLQEEFIIIFMIELAAYFTVAFFGFIEHFKSVPLIICRKLLLFDLVLRLYVLFQSVFTLVSLRALCALEVLIICFVLFIIILVY